MNSTMLKAQRDEFINSADNYTNKYQDVLLKIKRINMELKDSDDTYLYKYIIERNNELVNKITKLSSDAEKYKNLTKSKVDNKIYQLEQQELQEKLKKESLEEEPKQGG